MRASVRLMTLGDALADLQAALAQPPANGTAAFFGNALWSPEQVVNLHQLATDLYTENPDALRQYLIAHPGAIPAGAIPQEMQIAVPDESGQVEPTFYWNPQVVDPGTGAPPVTAPPEVLATPQINTTTANTTTANTPATNTTTTTTAPVSGAAGGSSVPPSNWLASLLSMIGSTGSAGPTTAAAGAGLITSGAKPAATITAPGIFDQLKSMPWYGWAAVVAGLYLLTRKKGGR